MDALLSKGVIPDLINGATPDGPVLQIIVFRKIPASGGQDRYRMEVSDGLYKSTFAMLATQLNGLVDSGVIKPLCLIKLERFICNTVQSNRKILIILDLSVVKSAEQVGALIGDPKTFVISKGLDTEETKAIPQARPATNNVSAPRTPLAQRNINMSSSSGLSPGTSRNVLPIASLSPYQNKWTICARVTSKSNIRTWSNSRGEGKLFSFDLLDESGEVKVTAFKDQCDAFYDVIQIGQVYYISSATLKTANKQYSNLKNDYEITFTQNTTVVPCSDITNIPTMQYDFVTLEQLERIEANTIIDVIGICTETADLSSVTQKSTGKEIIKRDVQIIDQTGRQVQLTLWSQTAESFDGCLQPVLAIKAAKLSDFSGRSLSLMSSSSLQINPDIPEAHKLKGWYDGGGKNMDVISLSNQRSNSGGVGGNLTTFAEAKLSNLGSSGNADYYSVKASIALIRKENCLYTACPSEGCNKKVIDLTNGLYRCEKCNREYDSYNWRLMLSTSLSDSTDNQWVTIFQDQAETILGLTSQELGSLRDHNPEAFLNVFVEATFKEFLLKLRVKMETYNDENRLKTTVVAVSPFDPKEYNRKLFQEIKQMAGL